LSIAGHVAQVDYIDGIIDVFIFG